MKGQPAAAFVGLATLDVLYRVEALAAANEKVVAQSQTTHAGGPAANAAITFAFLGGAAHLQAGLGRHAAAAIVRAELASYGVRFTDLAAEFDEPPSISSILILAATGERSVTSANATRLRYRPGTVDAAGIAAGGLLLVDGHNMEAAVEAARAARAHGVTTVMDGGSWKAGMEELLPLVDIAICSADYRLPGCGATPADVAGRLRAAGVGRVAMTRGAQPVLAYERDSAYEVPTPAVDVVDTLGAGDIFHGAFCWEWLRGGGDFRRALTFAGEVAAASCRHFGPRGWMSRWAGRG